KWPKQVSHGNACHVVGRSAEPDVIGRVSVPATEAKVPITQHGFDTVRYFEWTGCQFHFCAASPGWSDGSKTRRVGHPDSCCLVCNCTMAGHPQIESSSRQRTISVRRCKGQWAGGERMVRATPLGENSETTAASTQFISWVNVSLSL